MCPCYTFHHLQRSIVAISVWPFAIAAVPIFSSWQTGLFSTTQIVFDLYAYYPSEGHPIARNHIYQVLELLETQCQDRLSVPQWSSDIDERL